MSTRCLKLLQSNLVPAITSRLDQMDHIHSYTLDLCEPLKFDIARVSNENRVVQSSLWFPQGLNAHKQTKFLTKWQEQDKTFRSLIYVTLVNLHQQLSFRNSKCIAFDKSPTRKRFCLSVVFSDILFTNCFRADVKKGGNNASDAMETEDGPLEKKTVHKNFK